MVNQAWFSSLCMSLESSVCLLTLLILLGCLLSLLSVFSVFCLALESSICLLSILFVFRVFSLSLESSDSLLSLLSTAWVFCRSFFCSVCQDYNLPISARLLPPFAGLYYALWYIFLIFAFYCSWFSYMRFLSGSICRLALYLQWKVGQSL